MRTLVAALSVAALVIPAPAIAELDIREWQVPFAESRPRDPFAESADSVWFVGQRAGYLAHLDVGSGKIDKIDLKDGSGPHNLIVGSDGIVWYAGNRSKLIGRYDPATGEIEEIPMPDESARDPHTLIFDHDEANIWFTVQGGNQLGRLNLATRKVDLIASPTERSRPYGIKIAPDGVVWAVLFGTNKIARIDPESLQLTEFVLPRAEARPRRLEITADGKLWYGDYATGTLGSFDPASGQWDEWALPQGAGARPYGMASDSRGRIWVVATGVKPNEFTGFDPATGQFFERATVPSGGGVIRHMHYHAPSGSVWFGTDTNFVGRAIVEPDR